MSTFTIPPLIALLWGITNPYIKRGSELHKPYTKLAYLIPVALNLAGSLLFYYTLSNGKMSVVVPITNALTFIVTAVMGVGWMGEKVNSKRNLILGIISIVIGVVLQIPTEEWLKLALPANNNETCSVGTCKVK